MASLPPLLLGVNIDHAATLRQARYRDEPNAAGLYVEPDPVFLSLLAERAGADGITVHLREDRRHIQAEDVERLRESIRTRLNLEMAATDEMVAFAKEIGPDTVCIVPENRREVTTEGGLDVLANRDRIIAAAKALAEAGIAVSLFIDPDPVSIDFAAKIRCPLVELHTGSYARAWYQPEQRAAELQRIRDGARRAKSAGLTVNAGHGLNYINIGPVAAMPELHELNIGHSIISRALSTGLEESVREMKALMQAARR